MLDDIRQLIDTLLKVEALHAGAMTPGERDATSRFAIVSGVVSDSKDKSQ